MLHVLRVFGLLAEEGTEHPFADPGRECGLTGASAEETVTRSQGLCGVEADPVSEFRHERRIAHLGVVAADQVVEYDLALDGIGQEDDRDAVDAGGGFEKTKVGKEESAAVVGRAGGLAGWDGLTKRAAGPGTLGEIYIDRRVGASVERECSGPTAGSRRDEEILGGAAEADKEVVIVGIDDRRSTRQVGEDADSGAAGTEAPGLSVVAAGSEGGVAKKIGEGGIPCERRTELRLGSLIGFHASVRAACEVQP